MSAAFAVSLFPYYNNVFFFCRLSARFVSAVFACSLFFSVSFLIREFSFPPFSLFYFFSSKKFSPSLFLPFAELLSEALACITLWSQKTTFPYRLYRAFAVFLLFARVVRFPQRPSCPKFRLSGLYNLCPTPTSPSARKPTCPRTCLDSAPFFLPIFCSISIFCRFRVVFCF